MGGVMPKNLRGSFDRHHDRLSEIWSDRQSKWVRALNRILKTTKPHGSKTNCGATFTGSGPSLSFRRPGCVRRNQGTDDCCADFRGHRPEARKRQVQYKWESKPGRGLRDPHRIRARQFLTVGLTHPTVVSGYD